MNKELLECAKINFENLADAMPILYKHPYYLIAKAQLDEALGYQTVEESLHPPHPTKPRARRGRVVKLHKGGKISWTFRGKIHSWFYKDMFWTDNDPFSFQTVTLWLGFQ